MCSLTGRVLILGTNGGVTPKMIPYCYYKGIGNGICRQAAVFFVANKPNDVIKRLVDPLRGGRIEYSNARLPAEPNTDPRTSVTRFTQEREDGIPIVIKPLWKETRRVRLVNADSSFL